MTHAHHHDDPTVPRGALISAALLIGAVLAMTGAVRLGWLPQSGNPELSRAAANVAPAETRELRFADRADGAVVVTDASSDAVVTVVPYGEGGFLRATVRRMAKARRGEGVGAEPPFRLIRWSNGALSLEDPETGQRTEIYGFGPDHTRMFADMLEGRSA